VIMASTWIVVESRDLLEAAREIKIGLQFLAAALVLGCVALGFFVQTAARSLRPKNGPPAAPPP